MHVLRDVVVLVVLFGTAVVISEEEKKEALGEEEDVKFKNYYPDLGCSQGCNYYSQTPQIPQSFYPTYPYYQQPVSNSYTLPSQSYGGYSSTPYNNYQSYYQPYLNSQPYYSQYPYTPGAAYSGVGYSGYQTASLPLSSYQPASYPSASYPVVSNQYTSPPVRGPYAGYPSDIIDVDLTQSYNTPLIQQQSGIPQVTSTKVISNDIPYVYLGQTANRGIYTQTNPSYGNINDAFAGVPVEYVTVDQNGNRISGGDGAEKTQPAKQQPRVTVTSHSTYSGADPIVKTQSQIIKTKPISATITRTIDPNNKEQPIRISYVNGEKVEDDQAKSSEITNNEVEGTVEENEDEDENEEPSNVDSWFR